MIYKSFLVCSLSIHFFVIMTKGQALNTRWRTAGYLLITQYYDIFLLIRPEKQKIQDEKCSFEKENTVFEHWSC